MRSLFDVSLLLALLDTDHLDHGRAVSWLDDNAEGGWASCAITENGFVRIMSQPRYVNPVTPAAAAGVLRDATVNGDHEFWPSSVSILDEDAVRGERILGHRQVTDVYLLALAVAHGGRFVTFDRRISLDAVPGAKAEHLVVV